MKKVLVTGGCGFIGSHTIVDLLENGFEVICLDNNINSDESPLAGIEKITGKKIKNYKVDLCDLKATKKVFEQEKDISGIIHFAALKNVGESVEMPTLYFHNNMIGLVNILECAVKYGFPQFIFSSSCSVYGNAAPEDLPISENTKLQEAESPYARTKQMGEMVLRDYAKIYPELNTIALRYFNPAGAHESTNIGESPINPSQNLVPIITEVAIGKRPQLSVHGSDYETRDGTCIRDYIHVMDIADAHTKALQYLFDKKQDTNFDVFNLGIGDGVTVLEVIQAFEKSSGEKLNYTMGPRRAGDVVSIYANYSKAKEVLGWVPKRNIDDIMKTAWDWEKKRSEMVEA